MAGFKGIRPAACLRRQGTSLEQLAQVTLVNWRAGAPGQRMRPPAPLKKERNRMKTAESILLGVAICGAACYCCAMDQSAEPGQKVTVLKKSGAVYIRSYFSAEQDVLIAVAKGANGQINFVNTRLIPAAVPTDESALTNGLVFHRCSDDSTPWNLNGTYIGANHGCSAGLELIAANHGLTAADLGSAWADEATNKIYIIKITGPDSFWALPENKSNDAIWKFSGSCKGHVLKNCAGPRTLNFTKISMAQVIPACRIKTQKYLVNGQTPLEDGRATPCAYLDIEEEYDVIAPDSLLKAFQNNPGKAIDFTGSELEAVVNNRIVYRFLPMGACTVEHRSTARQNFQLGYMGFIQSSPLDQGAFGAHECYIPKTVPFELKGRKYDFAHFEDFALKLPNELLFGPKYRNISDAGNPPDRFMQFLGEKQGGAPARKIGYVIGYSLIEGITRPEQRAANCEAALYLYVSNKTYPHAIDGGTVAAGQAFHCLAYRQYFNPSAYKNATSVYWHQQAGAYILYIDYHQSVESDVIKLPGYLAGRQISVIEKTPSVKLLTAKTVPPGGIVLSVGDRYGYIVLRLE